MEAIQSSSGFLCPKIKNFCLPAIAEMILLMTRFLSLNWTMVRFIMYMGDARLELTTFWV